MDFVFGTYNFQNGGIDGTDPTRFRRQLRRLKEHGARAWALQECSNWDKNGCLEAAEDMLSMRGFIAHSTKNPGGNVAVFVDTRDHRVKVIRTRHESLKHDEKVPYWHAVAVVYVDVMGYALNEPERDVTGIHPAKVRRKSDTRAAVYLAEYMTDAGAHLGDTTPTVGHSREDKLAYICDRVYTTLPEDTIIGHRVVTDEDEDSDHRKVLTTIRLDTGS